MDPWSVLLETVVLLAVAMAMGMAFERIGQNAITGYLLAGTLLGPSVFNLVSSLDLIQILAELGVALLLFTIGLEFSFKRLKSLGKGAVIGGTLQVVVTALVVAAIAWSLGTGWKIALALGLIVAPSSTALVVRLLRDRGELDSIHGRNALGILLLQDAALAPLVVALTSLAGQGGIKSTVLAVAQSTLMAAVLLAALYVVIAYVLPSVMNAMAMTRNRELFVLLATVTCAGAAWSAHEFGLSPALGAFVAGVLLAESPFATQTRADIGAFRTLFATVFFCSIGMLADLSWVWHNWPVIVLTTVGLIIGKAMVIMLVMPLLGLPRPHAIATGITLAQVGEFSFVLSALAFSKGLLSESLLNLLIAVSVVSLFATPILVNNAATISAALHRMLTRGRPIPAPKRISNDGELALEDHVIVVGYGPAGEEVSRVLREEGIQVAVLDLNPGLVVKALQGCLIDGLEDSCMVAQLGDATHPDSLSHLRVGDSKAVVVTLPDHRATQEVVRQVRSLAPDTLILARGRLSRYISELAAAGADVTIDEEVQMGMEMGREAKARLL